VAVAAAVVVCAWFVLAIRELRDEAHVTAFLHGHPTLTASQTRTLDATLADAKFLNPDTSAEALRARVQVNAQDLPAAVAIALALARREPQNFDNWLLLEFLAGSVRPDLHRLAEAHVRALAPPVRRAP
jgi:hypothetical protein